MVLMFTAALGMHNPLLGGELTVHGFGTAGIAHLDKPDDWAYMRSLNQETSTESFRADLDSVLGLQVNYAPTENLELVGQMAAVALDGDATASDYLELAFLAWHPGDDWVVRVGRVNTDAFLYSDHREVGYTYEFIRPPVEFYARMPTSLDGGDVTRTWLVGDTQWRAKLFAGNASAGTGGGRLHLDPMIGAMVSRESAGLLMRITTVHAHTPRNIASVEPLLSALRQMQQVPVPQVAMQAAQMEQALTAKGSDTFYVAAGVAYDDHGWIATAEAARAKVKRQPSTSFESAYASIGHRFGKLSVFGMESATRRIGDVLQTPDWGTPIQLFNPQLAQQAQMIATGATMAINRAAGHQNTTSVGARWDLKPRLALKLQWDHVRTHANGDGLWAQGDGSASKANIFGLALDFLF